MPCHGTAHHASKNMQNDLKIHVQSLSHCYAHAPCKLINQLILLFLKMRIYHRATAFQKKKNSRKGTFYEIRSQGLDRFSWAPLQTVLLELGGASPLGSPPRKPCF